MKLQVICMKRAFIILSVCMALSSGCCNVATAQDVDYEQTVMIVDLRLTQFVNDMNSLMQLVSHASLATLGDIERDYNSLDFRWNVYYQAQQVYIADNEHLLDIVAAYQQTKENVKTIVEKQKKILIAKQLISETEKLIEEKLPIYDDLLSDAKKYSATDKTQEQLDRVKLDESIHFSEVETKYQATIQASADIDELKPRIKSLNAGYIDIKNKSNIIAQMAYVPFMERIKNYIVGFAIVAVMMLIVSVIHSKIVTIKQMRDNAKKLKEQYIKDGKDEIPSI